MYEEIIKIFHKNNIKLTSGLTCEEINQIEKLYKIKFPKPLKNFLKTAVPIGTSFYNWRDFSDKNIAYIRETINIPKKGLYELANDVDWCETWGKEPISENEKVEKIRKMLETAPTLIPIYSHRYMPMGKLKEYPIISVHGSDIIYYGKNLENYFKIEFGDDIRECEYIKYFQYIPFWTDLM